VIFVVRIDSAKLSSKQASQIASAIQGAVLGELGQLDSRRRRRCQSRNRCFDPPSRMARIWIRNLRDLANPVANPCSRSVRSSSRSALRTHLMPASSAPILCPSSRCQPGRFCLASYSPTAVWPLPKTALPSMEPSLTSPGGAALLNRDSASARVREFRMQSVDGQPLRRHRLVLDEAAQVGYSRSHEESLPDCSIRAQCRWFDQSGGSACAVCDQIVTDSDRTATSCQQSKNADRHQPSGWLWTVLSAGPLIEPASGPFCEVHSSHTRHRGP